MEGSRREEVRVGNGRFNVMGCMPEQQGRGAHVHLQVLHGGPRGMDRFSGRQGCVRAKVQLERLQDHPHGVNHLVEVGDAVSCWSLVEPTDGVVQVHVMPHDIKRSVAGVRLHNSGMDAQSVAFPITGAVLFCGPG